MTLEYLLKDYDRFWSDKDYMSCLKTTMLPYLRYFPGKASMNVGKKPYRLVRSNFKTIPNNFHYANIFFREDDLIWTEYVGDIEYSQADVDVKRNIRIQLSLAGINPIGYYIFIRKVKLCYLVYGDIYFPTETIATLIPGNLNRYDILLMRIDTEDYTRRGGCPLWNGNKMDLFDNIPIDIVLEILSFNNPKMSDDIYLNSPSISERHMRLKSMAEDKYKNEKKIYSRTIDGYSQSPENYRRYILNNIHNDDLENTIQEAYHDLFYQDRYDKIELFKILLGFETKITMSIYDIFSVENPIPYLELILPNLNQSVDYYGISNITRIRQFLEFDYSNELSKETLKKISPFDIIMDGDYVTEDKDILEDIIDFFISHGYQVTIEDRGISIISDRLRQTKWSDWGEHFNETREWFLLNMKNYDLEYEQIEYIASKPLSRSQWKVIWNYFMDEKTIDLMPETKKEFSRILSYVDKDSIQSKIIQLYRKSLFKN